VKWASLNAATTAEAVEELETLHVDHCRGQATGSEGSPARGR
jgi:hypothetical protein